VVVACFEVCGYLLGGSEKTVQIARLGAGLARTVKQFLSGCPLLKHLQFFLSGWWGCLAGLYCSVQW
jgi:hypothetical protein